MSRNLVHITKVNEHRSWCTVAQARKLVYEGRLSRYKLGGKVLIDLDELDRLVVHLPADRPPAA